MKTKVRRSVIMAAATSIMLTFISFVLMHAAPSRIDSLTVILPPTNTYAQSLWADSDPDENGMLKVDVAYPPTTKASERSFLAFATSNVKKGDRLDYGCIVEISNIPPDANPITWAKAAPDKVVKHLVAKKPDPIR